MMKGIAVSTLASILVLGLITPALTISPNDAFAATINIDKVQLDNDWEKLKLKVSVAGFTITQQSDLQVTIILRNNANGEQAVATAPVATIETVDSVPRADKPKLESSRPAILIDKVQLDNDWEKLKLKVSVAGFTITQQSDLQVTIILRNNANQEQAVVTVPVAPIEII